jgi:hypothetical protein
MACTTDNGSNPLMTHSRRNPLSAFLLLAGMGLFGFDSGAEAVTIREDLYVTNA